MSKSEIEEIKQIESQYGEKPNYSIIFKIILPFWIDLPHQTKLQKKFNKKSYKIQIFHDLWKIHWRTRIGSSFFIIKEENVIDINYLKPRLNYDHINPFLDSDIHSDLEKVYFPEKLKTLIQVSIELNSINSKKEVINFLKEQDNWQDVKNIVNYFLSIYIYIRINSNFTDHIILPVGDNYYSSENVLVSFKNNQNNIEDYIFEASTYLNLPAETYHPMYKCNDTTLEYFQEKFEKGENLKLRLHERLKILIDFAKKSRDINSLIIYNTIYLERVSIQYLSKKREIDEPELEILYKAKGLSHFVEDQLPHFLENEVEPELIKDAIELVIKRNEIIHLGVVFVYSNELELKCDNVLKLISYLESVIYSTDSPEFFFDPYITGVIREIHENNIAKIELFHSLKESEYHKEFNIRLDKIPEETLRSINKISKDYKNYKLPKLFLGVFKIFYKENDYIINFSLNPTQLEQNIDFFQKLIEYLKEKIIPSELKLYLLFNNIPPSNLDLIFKLLHNRINQIKQDYGLEEIKVITFQFIVNQEEAEIFQNIIGSFKNENVELLSKKVILLQSIKKEKIEAVLRKYPIVFDSQIINGEEYIKLTEWFSNAYGFKKFN